MAGSRVRDVVNAAIDALRANSSLAAELGLDEAGNVKAYTHVPQNTDPPFCIVLGGDELPWAVTFEENGDSGDNGGRRVDVIIQCNTKRRGTSQVDEIASLVMETLTDADTYSLVDGFQLAELTRNAIQPPSDFQGEMWFIRIVTITVTLV